MSARSTLLLLPLLACGAHETAAPAPAKAQAPAAPPAPPAQKFTVAPPPAALDPGRRARAAELGPKLDKLFADDLAASNYPGLGVAIVLDGETVYMKGFGQRDLASKAPFDADTVFRVASVTKSFTAMAALKLRDEGRLALDVPAVTYDPILANLAYPTRDSPPLTVRQLLTHGSGLPEDNFYLDVSIEMNAAQLEDLLRPGLSFSRAPDTHFEYSNIGFGVVGRIIERVAGMPARKYIAREILGPLGMTASGWEPEDIARDHLAVGYWGADGYLGRDKQKIAAPVYRDGAFDVAGGLYTTLRDMTRYVAFHLSAWPPRDEPERGPVRRSTLREMHQGTRRGDLREFGLIAPEPPPVARATADSFELHSFSYGDGFFTTTTCADDFTIEHSGGLPGFTTFLTMLPESGYGIIVFVNDVRVQSRPDQAATALFREAGLLGRRPVTPVPALLAAQDSVGRLLQSFSDDEATRLLEPTFLVYEPLPLLGADFKKLAETHGHCETGPLDAPNLLRGRWRMKCERGAIRFAAALSPRADPRLQFLVWQSELPPTPHMTRAATALLAGKGAFVQPEAARAALARLAVDGGKCRLGEPVRGDGNTAAVFALVCSSKAPLLLDVHLDDKSDKSDKSGKVAAFRVYPPPQSSSPNCAR